MNTKWVSGYVLVMCGYVGYVSWLCVWLCGLCAVWLCAGFFRVADALGVEKIFLTGESIVPPNPKIKKTSRATEKYVEYEYQENPILVINKLKNFGYKIISLEITSASLDVKDFYFSNEEKICLILGSENSGVCQELLDASDKSIHIPMLGNNSSMNVANACSIATYELTRRY